METKGTIKTIMQTQQVSDKFKKREFVVTTEGQYPQDVLFQVTQDKCNVLDSFKQGQSVTVAFNLKGRESNGKYYNTLEAWKIN
jgi:hypothetical protein